MTTEFILQIYETTSVEAVGKKGADLPNFGDDWRLSVRLKAKELNMSMVL